jgi:hypothetical protein
MDMEVDSQQSDDFLVKENDFVVVKLHEEKGTLIKVTKDKCQKIGQTNVSVKPIIGVPYGSLFRLEKRVLTLISDDANSDLHGMAYFHFAN